MRTLKGWLTSGVLLGVLLLGSSVAKADGIIFGLAGDSGSTTCNDNGGIIFGATGIIFGFSQTGIIFGLDGTGDSSCTENNLGGLLISD